MGNYGNTLSRIARQRGSVCAAVGDLVKNPASLLRSGVKHGVVPWRSSLANYALWRKGVIMSTPLFTTVVVSVGCGRISLLTNFGLTYKEHTKKIQRTCKEHTKNMQRTYKEHTKNIYKDNIQRT